MKNLSFLILIFLFSANLKAQVDISTNPIALLFEVGVVSVEYNVDNDWGIGGDIMFGQGGGLLYATGKHYFNPKYGADKFNLGAFLGTAGGDGDYGFGLGFLVGYKWLSARGVSLELALGVGRDFTGETGALPYGKFNVGYRFKK